MRKRSQSIAERASPRSKDRIDTDRTSPEENTVRRLPAAVEAQRVRANALIAALERKAYPLGRASFQRGEDRTREDLALAIDASLKKNVHWRKRVVILSGAAMVVGIERLLDPRTELELEVGLARLLERRVRRVAFEPPGLARLLVRENLTSPGRIL